MSDIYFMTIECKNCKLENRIAISKGTTIKDFFKENKTCRKCGCKLEVKE